MVFVGSTAVKVTGKVFCPEEYIACPRCTDLMEAASVDEITPKNKTAAKTSCP
jgi:hypothetical protein